MKLLCVSDLHLDVVTMGVPRFPELVDALMHTVEVAIAAKVDGYVFLGDLCDPDSGPVVFRCVELAIRTADFLRRNGIPSWWLAGNHDVIEDGSGRTTLDPVRHSGMVIEDPMGWAVLDKKGKIVANFVGLPFTATSHPYDPSEILRKNLLDDGTPNVVFSHLSVPGIIPGEETIDMPRGRDVMLPVELLARPDVLVVQGHYHRQQVHQHKGATVNVVGSLARLTFGEESHNPGYLLVEVA